MINRELTHHTMWLIAIKTFNRCPALISIYFLVSIIMVQYAVLTERFRMSVYDVLPEGLDLLVPSVEAHLWVGVCSVGLPHTLRAVVTPEVAIVTVGRRRIQPCMKPCSITRCTAAKGSHIFTRFPTFLTQGPLYLRSVCGSQYRYFRPQTWCIYPKKKYTINFDFIITAIDTLNDYILWGNATRVNIDTAHRLGQMYFVWVVNDHLSLCVCDYCSEELKYSSCLCFTEAPPPWAQTRYQHPRVTHHR